MMMVRGQGYSINADLPSVTRTRYTYMVNQTSKMGTPWELGRKVTV